MRKSINQETIISFLMLTIGAILAAFSIEEFLAPNNIYDGGIVGISMIIDYYLPLKLSHIIVILSIPFVIFGIKRLGKRFVVKFIYATIVFSVMTEVFAPFANATREKILAVVFGGIFLGAGVGLVLRGGGCLDGTEIVGVIMSRKFSVSTAQVVLIFNIIIYTVAGFCFSLDSGMYSLIMYLITSKVIDYVEIGLDSAKSVIMITEDGTALAEKIYEELGRTVTFIKGEGLVSNSKKVILYCVVTRAEIFELKSIIKSVPGSTFTTISEVSEIVGNHMKSSKATLHIPDNE